MEIMFTKLARKGWYRVYGRNRDSHTDRMDTNLGEVSRVEVHKSPWSDRPRVLKWGAFNPDGERIAVCATRKEAGERLVPR